MLKKNIITVKITADIIYFDFSILKKVLSLLIIFLFFVKDFSIKLYERLAIIIEKIIEKK